MKHVERLLWNARKQLIDVLKDVNYVHTAGWMAVQDMDDYFAEKKGDKTLGQGGTEVSGRRSLC